MRIRRSNTPIPREFSTHPAGAGIAAECDIGLGTGSLFAKLLVFQRQKDLRDFWRNGLGRGNELGPRCLGAVNGLAYERVDLKGRSTLVVDPRYFCVICLVRGHLSMEIVCHEAVHAAFNYAKRKKGDMWAGALDLDEESVCYPAGLLAAAINQFLHRNGLYTTTRCTTRSAPGTA